MIQLPTEIRRHRLSGDLNAFFHAAISEPRTIFGHRKALGLITGLIVAVGVTIPAIAATRPLGPATSLETSARSGEGYVPGALAGYVGSDDWALAEGGAFGGYAYRPGSLAGYAGPEDWALAEGGAHPGFVVPSPAVVNEWAQAEGGAFGGQAYRPGALAGYAGPEDWALAEGGPLGSVMVPSPEVVQDWARAEGGFYGSNVLPSTEVVQGLAR